MNLFSAAGLDLPSGSSSGKRRTVVRRAHMPLFAPKIIKKYIGLTPFNPTDEQSKAAADYARRANSGRFSKLKEADACQALFERILGKLLGYSLPDPDDAFTLRYQQSIGRGYSDVALGQFSVSDGDKVYAPLEMKGPDTYDLDAIMPGRGKSPVQQAWEYAMDSPGAQWVLVSN